MTDAIRMDHGYFVRFEVQLGRFGRYRLRDLLQLVPGAAHNGAGAGAGR